MSTRPGAPVEEEDASELKLGEGEYASSLSSHPNQEELRMWDEQKPLLCIVYETSFFVAKYSRLKMCFLVVLCIGSFSLNALSG